MSAAEKIKRGLDRSLEAVLVLAMGFSVLVVLWQVVSRYVLTEPSSFTDELVRYLLVWIGLLGGAHGVGQKLHLSIDLLPSRLDASRRHRLAALVQALIVLFALAVPGFGGLRLVSLTLELGQRSASLGLPLGWIYLVLPLSALVMACYGTLFAADHLRRANGRPGFFDDLAAGNDSAGNDSAGNDSGSDTGDAGTGEAS